MTKIIKDIDIAVSEILGGNVIAVPTETVYGLGANALDQNAVVKIYEIKERPAFNPIIIHIYGIENVYNYAEAVPEKALKLMECFSPGPISFILNKKSIIPDIVTAGHDTVAVRFPWHPLLTEVLKEVKVPVSAPSANISGRISPTSAEDVLKELNGRVEFILDGGKCTIGIESTVVSFEDDEVTILRPGYITKEEIENVVGNVKDNSESKLISPGLLKHHYSPSTQLYLTDEPGAVLELSNDKIGYLNTDAYKDLKQMAVNLFSDIRKLDEDGYSYIIAKKVTSEGIGRAINDRLEKASSGSIEVKKGKLKFKTR